MHIWWPNINICQLVNKYAYLNYSYCSYMHISCENHSAFDPFRLHGFSHVGIRGITYLPNNHATRRQHHNPASQPLPTDCCRSLPIHNSFHLPPDSCRSPRLHPFVVRQEYSITDEASTIRSQDSSHHCPTCSSNPPPTCEFSSLSTYLVAG